MSEITKKEIMSAFYCDEESAEKAIKCLEEDVDTICQALDSHPRGRQAYYPITEGPYSLREQWEKKGMCSQKECIMNALDFLLNDGTGVEAIQMEGAYVDSFSHDIVATYLNTGDSYSSTIVLDSDSLEFEISSFGDWLERYESGQIQQVLDWNASHQDVQDLLRILEDMPHYFHDTILEHSIIPQTNIPDEIKAYPVLAIDKQNYCLVLDKHKNFSVKPLDDIREETKERSK